MIHDKHFPRMVNILNNRLRWRIEGLSFKGQYSGSQGKVLHFILIHSDDEIFQKDIEEEFGLRPPSATTLLKNMEGNGLITRVPIAYDGRYKRIIPSEKAMLLKDKVVREMEELEAKLVRDISPEELAVWTKVTEKMIENI